MEQKKFMGPLIGQAINLLVANDAEFREQFLSKSIGCKEHEKLDKNTLFGTEYSTDCAACNSILLMCQTKVEVVTKRILHFDRAIENTLNFKEAQKTQLENTPPPVAKVTLDGAGFKRKTQGQYGYKLYQDKQCVLEVHETAILFCAGKPFSEQGGSFMKHKLPVWVDVEETEDDSKIIVLEIPETSKKFLEGMNADKGLDIVVGAKMHQGQYGNRRVATWRKA